MGEYTQFFAGLAGGGVSTTIVSWLLGRGRQQQIDLPDIARKYWDRIDQLEKQVATLNELAITLSREISQRDDTIRGLQSKVERLERRTGVST